MLTVLVSACLIGERVRIHGGDARVEHPVLDRWLHEGRLVPVCPEVLGGLGIPRPPAEIIDGRVFAKTGADVTEEFERGARIAADTATENRVAIAIMKSRSPSCGSGMIYDGTFSGRMVPGDGKTTALLRERGIAVFSELELDEAAAYLDRLEAGA
jgi:uncharacterized protein YbbK (DUF523 family)